MYAAVHVIAVAYLSLAYPCRLAVMGLDGRLGLGAISPRKEPKRRGRERSPSQLYELGPRDGIALEAHR